jgi:glycosyltransferase involved in cell wall biosynthesis
LKHHAARFAIISNDAFSVLNFRSALLSDIVSRGHQVFALAPRLRSVHQEALAELGVEAIDISMSRTGLNPFKDAGDVLRLSRILSELKPDVVLSFAIKPVIYGTMAARLAGVPHRFALVAGLGYAFGDNVRTRISGVGVHYVARSLYTLALSHTEKVFVQNPDDARDLAQMGIVASDKIVQVNGSGVDLDAWPKLPPVAEPVTFLLAARLLAAKGIREYVEAARLVKSRYPAARFVLLGGVDSNPDAIAGAEVEQWVGQGIIEWPGHVNVRPWLAQSSVYVLPSYYREGIPRSVLEALASGRPVITADTPGCRETVIDGVNGYLVPPRNPQALATAMLRFVEDPGLIVDMGNQSRLIAQSRFDVGQVNGRMTETMGL